ncbi:MAG: type IV pilus assembly protein PilM [Actinomycetota bacterium]
MAGSRIGLDIGSTAARAAEVRLGGDAASLVRAAQVPLPPGSVEAGEIREPAAVGEALRELWGRGGFRSKQVHMGVGNQRVVVREVALPYLPEKELRETLGYQVQEFIPIAVEEAVLDFDTLGEFEHEGKRMLRLLLVAAHRAMVGTVVDATGAAKLQLVGLDLNPFAVVRSVGTVDGDIETEAEGEEAVVDVGAHVTNICVHDRGVTRFVRILPSGGRDVTVAIARAMNVSDEDAERLKRGEETEGGHSVEDARKVAMGRAASFVDEIRSSLQFYTAQTPGTKIGRVLVTGGGSKLEGLLEMFQERLPAPVERGRPLTKIRSELNLTEEALAEAEPVLAVALGLALPGRHQ